MNLHTSSVSLISDRSCPVPLFSLGEKGSPRSESARISVRLRARANPLFIPRYSTNDVRPQFYARSTQDSSPSRAHGHPLRSVWGNNTVTETNHKPIRNRSKSVHNPYTTAYATALDAVAQLTKRSSHQRRQLLLPIHTRKNKKTLKEHVERTNRPPWMAIQQRRP